MTRGVTRPPTLAGRILADLAAHTEGLSGEQLAVRLSAGAGTSGGSVRAALDRLLADGTVRSMPVMTHHAGLRVYYYLPPGGIRS